MYLYAIAATGILYIVHELLAIAYSKTESRKMHRINGCGECAPRMKVPVFWPFYASSVQLLCGVMVSVRNAATWAQHSHTRREIFDLKRSLRATAHVISLGNGAYAHGLDDNIVLPAELPFGDV